MRRLSFLLFSAHFLLFTVGICLAGNEVAEVTDRPITPAGLSEGGSKEELKVPLTAAEEKMARSQRDSATPELLQRPDGKGGPAHLGERMYEYVTEDPAEKSSINAANSRLDLAEVRRILAQIHGKQELETREPQAESGKLQLTLEQSLEISLKKNLRIQISTLARDEVAPEVPKAEAMFHPTVGLALTASGERIVPEERRTVEVNTQALTAFIRQEVPTGGTITLSTDLSRDDTDDITLAEEFGSAFAIEVVQPLMRGGRIYVATQPIRDAEFNLNIEEARLRAEILKVTEETKSAYYNMVLAEEVIEVTNAAIQRDRTLTEASEALLKAGLVTLRDVASAKISLAQNLARLVDDRADLKNARDILLDVLGLPIATQVALVDKDIGFEPVELELERWIATATKNRPEILEIEEELASSELNIRVAGNGVLPQLDLVGSYKRSQAGRTVGKVFDLGGEEWRVGLVFSIPIGNVAAQSELSQAGIEYARLQEELSETKRQIELEVRDDVIKLQRNSERIDPLTEVVVQAKAKLEVAKARFVLGQATNKDITDAQDDLRDAETELLEATVDYNIGLAELEASIAGPI